MQNLLVRYSRHDLSSMALMCHFVGWWSVEVIGTGNSCSWWWGLPATWRSPAGEHQVVSCTPPADDSSAGVDSSSDNSCARRLWLSTALAHSDASIEVRRQLRRRGTRSRRLWRLRRIRLVHTATDCVGQPLTADHRHTVRGRWWRRDLLWVQIIVGSISEFCGKSMKLLLKVFRPFTSPFNFPWCCMLPFCRHFAQLLIFSFFALLFFHPRSIH